MSAFAVAAFHDRTLPAGAGRFAVVVWIRATGLGDAGADVALELWTPAGAAVTALREVAPAASDRLAARVRIDDRTLRIDAGRWQDGVHEFGLELVLAPRDPGDELLAARIGVLAGHDLVAEAVVAVSFADVPAGALPAGADAEPPTSAVAPADLPTGASPEPRHRASAPGAPGPCVGCGEPAEEGDRFCEACGLELAAG